MPSAVIPYANSLYAANLAATPTISAYGNPIPKLFGRTRVKASLIWANAIVGKVVSFAVAFGAPAPNTAAVVCVQAWIAGLPVASSLFTFYPGSQTQPVDPTIAHYNGPLTTAYRGLIYAVFTDFDLTNYAGVIPTIEMEILQNVTNFSPTTPLLPNNTTHSGYSAGFVDYRRGEFVAFAGNVGEISVFDIRTNFNLKFTAPITSGIWAFKAVSPSFLNLLPLMYCPVNAASNQTPIQLINYDTGAVVGGFGSLGSGLSSDATHICEPTCLTAAKGLAGFDDTVFAGTVFSEMVVLKRSGTTLSYHTVFTTSAAPHVVSPAIVLGTVPALANPIATQQPFVDNTLFTLGYVGIGATICRVVATSDHTAKTALQRPLCITSGSSFTWSTTLLATGTLSEGVTSLITLGANEIAEFIYPIASADFSSLYVAAIIRNTVSGVFYWRKYATVWSPEYTLNGGVDASSTINMDVFTQLQSVIIPSMDVSGYARCSKYQHCFRNPNAPDVLGYASTTGAIWYMLNLLTGSLTEFDVSDTTFVSTLDGTTIYQRPFDVVDIYDPTTGYVYFPAYGGTTPHNAPYPGLIQLYANTSVDELNLGVYLTALALTAGYLDSDIETDGLAGIFIRGSIINVTVSLIALLTQICGLFRVDIVESSGKIKFVKKTRGASMALDLTLTQENLAPYDQSNPNKLTDNTRATSDLLPVFASCDYLDADNYNAIGMQTAKRTIFPIPTIKSTASVAFSVPIIMTAQEALYWATYALFDIWGGAKTSTFRLPQVNLAVEAGDYIQLTLDNGDVNLYKANIVTYNADYSITIAGQSFAQYSDFASPNIINNAPPDFSGSTGGTIPPNPVTSGTPLTDALDVLIFDNCAMPSYLPQVPTLPGATAQPIYGTPGFSGGYEILGYTPITEIESVSSGNLLVSIGLSTSATVKFGVYGTAGTIPLATG